MNRHGSRLLRAAGHILAVCTLSLAIAACGGGGGSGSSSPSEAGTNHSPQISGSPGTTVRAGSAYAFRPAASDPDGDPLSFQISNLPGWASFDSVSGALTGTPGNSDVGQSGNIVIRVSDGRESAALAAFSIQVLSAAPPPTGNVAPVILGTPVTSVSAGQNYSFQPAASDANGDTLTFSISNKPAWALFNAATGRLSGTPSGADVGTYSSIVIRVSDGIASTSLASFAISVTQGATGTATISWIPPTENTDGTPLIDLAGYRIYYGTDAATLSEVIELSNPGLTTYVVQDLSPNTWYFALRAYRIDGTESDSSNVASKRIL